MTPDSVRGRPTAAGSTCRRCRSWPTKGLIYTQWHTAALSSPTRSTLLTGRNHHSTAWPSITEGANGFPGASGQLPAQCATIAQILQDGGWSTFWLGKNHNVAEQDVASGREPKTVAAPEGLRPLLRLPRGRDEPVVSRPRRGQPVHRAALRPGEGLPPVEGPGGQGDPDDPRPEGQQSLEARGSCGTTRAPITPLIMPRRTTSRSTRGSSTMATRRTATWVLPRMIEKGILPKGTQLTPLNPMPEAMANPADIVRPWDSLNADEKKLFSRMAEVYAGFSEYTDVQIGRIIDYLEKTGQLENTVVFYCRRQRRVRGGESQRFGQREQVLQRLSGRAGGEHEIPGRARVGPDTYEHFPTGWAAAFSTPFQMFKRYAEYSGGTWDPLIISWPKGIKARGEIRNQYHHSTDIVPTILDICGLRDAEGLSRRRAVPALRRFDALHLRCEARRSDAEEASVLRHARHPRDLGGWLEGGGRPCPADRQGTLRQGRVAAVPRGRRPLRVEGSGRRKIPRNSRR